MDKYRQSVFPFVILTVIIIYTYTLFDGMPYLGFYYSYRDEITSIFVPEAEILMGGRIRKVGGVEWGDLKRATLSPLFEGLEPGDLVQMTIEKDGRLMDIAWTLPLDTTNELAARVRSTWWLPFVFWLAGTVTWFAIRPRNRVWELLVAFNMLIAVYLSGLNGPSLGNRVFSVPVVRVLGCLTLPIFLHLHWEFPKSLAPLPGRGVRIVYIISLVVGILTAVNLLPTGTFIAFSVFAVIGSILIMGAKLFLQPKMKRNNGFILVVFLLIFLPPLGTTIAYAYLNEPLDYIGFIGSYFAMPALPSAYFLIAFQPQMYGRRMQRQIRWIYLALVFICSLLISALLTFLDEQSLTLSLASVVIFMGAVALLSFSIVLIPMLSVMGYSERTNFELQYFSTGLKPRSNYLLTPYLFLIVFGVFSSFLIMLVIRAVDLSLRDIEIILVTGFVVASLTLVIYPWFRRLVEFRLYGVSQNQRELTESFARRITTTLSLTDLSNLLEREILPNLLVRQSSLHYLNESGTMHTLLNFGVPESGSINLDELIPLFPAGDHSRLVLKNPIKGIFPEWVKIVFPLRMSGKLIGVWMLGQHDPDDEYSQSELSTLQTISNQTAIALSNILKTVQLHAHYQADIDREEATRVEIARGLHDQVLNQLASLAMQITSGSSQDELIQSYEKVKVNLRELIARLRPSILDFGLSHAIHDLSTHLMDTYSGTRILVDLPYQSPRYDPHVENHVYTIILQVCENALRHADANQINISGSFEEGLINVSVYDDGIGFNFKEINYTELIENRRFGLVGIQERADLIHATLVIDSAPGAGTRILLRWENKND